MDGLREHSAANPDQQGLLRPPCHVKPLPPQINSVCDSTPSVTEPTGSPGEDSRTRGPIRKPLAPGGSLPAPSVDTLNRSLPAGMVPPPPLEQVGCPDQSTKTPLVSIPTTVPPPSGSYSRTPSPFGASRCHLMEEELCYTRHPQSPPPPTHPIRNWSCLHLNPPDVVDCPVNPPISSPLNSQPPPGPQPGWMSSPPDSEDCRASQPVERWAENVNRYYGSQNAAGGVEVPGEELSELDSLYQASLLAPSMPRGSHGVGLQPASHQPGNNTNLQQFGEHETNALNLPIKGD